MSTLTNRNTGQKDKKQDSSSSDDKLTDDFSEEESKEELELQQKLEARQTQMKNSPIPLSSLSNAKLRTIYTLIMLFAFILIIAAGPFYCALLVTILTAGVFREIINLTRKRHKEYKIPYFMLINWYFFFVGMFYFYGSFIASKISEDANISDFLRIALSQHKFISFMLWVFGFLMFVMSLQIGFLRYQIRFFGWTHLTIFIVVAQTSVIVMNLYEGIVWFLLPALLVISNDIFAYVFGKMYGKTKLIQLSPNKTWEGFIGGFFSSVVFALIFSYIFQNIPYLICENNILQVKIFQFDTCQINPLFISQRYELPSAISFLIPFDLYFSQFQLHSIYLSLFASLIAPFGGFFASGFKRALQVKDFGSSIPGHGGITDRMDCQLLMGTFTFCYLNYVIIGSALGVAASISSHFKKLSIENQKQLLDQLKQTYLDNVQQIQS